jgi:hypothetical protein
VSWTASSTVGKRLNWPGGSGVVFVNVTSTLTRARRSSGSTTYTAAVSIV